MSVKCPSQPLCRACAKPIRKVTTTHYIKGPDCKPHPSDTRTEWIKVHYPGHSIMTKAECQRLVIGTVVSISRANDAPWHGDARDDGLGRICKFTTWDGESYADDLFCCGPCAVTFARMTAYHFPQVQTKAYAAAAKGKAA
jgi:hypothetical protein